MLANDQIQKLHARRGSYASQVLRYLRGHLIRLSSYRRIAIVNWCAIIITVLIILRIIFLNTLGNIFLSKQFNVRVLRNIETIAMRGTVSDRLGEPLAVSTPVASIWADPEALRELTADQVRQIARILDMPVGDIDNKLNEKRKTFVYLKRAVSPKVAEQIKNLVIPGIYSAQEYKRFYPNAAVTAHVVGFTNVGDKGVEGIEFANNSELHGHNGLQQILRDRQGNAVDNVGNDVEAVNGSNITLSIDNRIQYIAYSALQAQVNAYHAKGGSSIVLDAKTGEVLAMVNMPTYNPNNRVGVDLQSMRNRAAIDIYEPGSTIKPFIVAKAINEKKVTANTVFNTNPYKIGSKLIQDDHFAPQLTVAQIIQQSSDVGVSKIAMMFNAKELWDYDTALGFGHKLGTEFPGEAKGILIPWQRWQPLDQASTSYGYAISVSLMQMVHAYTLFTNNGCLLPLSFYKNDGTIPPCQQLITPRTAHIMRQILTGVTDQSLHNTGKKADVDGYLVAGKTGTAHKSNGHGYYTNRYVASFIGFLPADRPKIIVAVMIDEPQGNYHGGAVAAPVFSQIATATMPLLEDKKTDVYK